jgi:hypothetical protein
LLICMGRLQCLQHLRRAHDKLDAEVLKAFGSKSNRLLMMKY